MENRRNVAEFFAGIGLVRIGLEKAGWKVVYANDIDAMKERAYRHHFENNQDFQLADVHEVSAGTIPDVELATASFPCTDLSLAGRQVGLAGKHSSAFWGFVKVLDDMGDRRPKMVLLENVEGFLTSHGGEDLEQALLALNDLGYAVDVFIIDARHFVPQSRRRLFVVGAQGDCEEQPVTDVSNLRPSKLINFVKSHPQVRWCFRHLPPLPELRTTLSDFVDLLSPNDPEWWNDKRTRYFFSQMSDRHTRVVDALQDDDHYHYLTAFRRVRYGKSMAEIRNDGIAGCLRTPKGGSARQILVEVGKGQARVRYMTPREYAKLMGAGDYHLTGSKTDQLFGFGDAVCVPVITWIAENYLNPVLSKSILQDVDAAPYAG